MAPWIAATAVFLALMWVVLATGYSECGQGGCGDSYPVAVGTFYAAAAALIALIAVSVARWMRRRR